MGATRKKCGMKRFWLARETANTDPEINELIVYKDPSDTYQEAADRAETILKRRSGRIYVLEAMSYIQAAEFEWAHLTNRGRSDA